MSYGNPSKSRTRRLLGLTVSAAVLLGLCDGRSPAQQGGDRLGGRADSLSDWTMGTIANAAYQDAPITSVFKMISDLTGWSILMSPEVSRQTPRVNMWIKNLSPKEALQQVCRIAGLAWHREGTTVLVLTFAEYGQRFGLAKRVIELKHASAENVTKILQPFAGKDDQARILSDPRANAVVLLVPEALLVSLEQLIATLDVELAQSEDTIRIVTLKHLEAARIGPQLNEFLTQTAGKASGNAPRTKGPAPKSSDGDNRDFGVLAGEAYLVRFLTVAKLNALVLRGLESDVDKVQKLIEELDVPQQVFVKSYPLKYTDAEELYDTLKQIVDADTSESQSAQKADTAERVHVAVSPQNNRIVVKGAANDHQRIAAVIEAIDQPRPAGTGGIRVYRLENASADQVVAVVQELIDSAESGSPRAGKKRPDSPSEAQRGIRRVQSPTPPTGASAGDKGGPSESGLGDDPPARAVAAAEINAVIIQASAVQHEEFAEIIAQLDRPRDQVVLEVTLVSVQSSDGFDFGLELGKTCISGGGVSTVGFTHFGIGGVDTATGEIRLPSNSLLGANVAVFKADEFSIVLNALKSVGDARITSAPKIVTEDNSPATISHVSQEPFETTDQGETTTTTTFGGFVDAGTVLSVLPHISQDNWLRLTYQATFSTFNARTAPSLPPPRVENSIEGTVRIPADHMVVLGGLAGTRHENVTTAVPLLSDIPLLGALFTNRSKNKTYETLYVFVRPVIVCDRNFDDLLAVSQADIAKARLTRQDEPTNPLKMLPSPAPPADEKEQ